MIYALSLIVRNEYNGWDSVEVVVSPLLQVLGVLCLHSVDSQSIFHRSTQAMQASFPLVHNLYIPRIFTMFYICISGSTGLLDHQTGI